MNPEKIGLMIKEIRKEKHFTQREFARMFGVTYQAVSKWENGRNIPDIAILTDICNRYNYDIQEFLNGESVKNKKTKWFVLLGGITCSFFLLLISVLYFMPDTFSFTTLSSNCENFEITGSMAYNKEKTSIYISNVSYCGKEDSTKYESIKCSLYEDNGFSKIKIEECPVENLQDTTLDDFLKSVTFHVEDYIKTCKNYTSNSLYLEIQGKSKEGKEANFKIPLKLNDSCTK